MTAGARSLWISSSTRAGESTTTGIVVLALVLPVVPAGQGGVDMSLPLGPGGVERGLDHVLQVLAALSGAGRATAPPPKSNPLV